MKNHLTWLLGVSVLASTPVALANSISYSAGGTGKMQMPGPTTPAAGAPWGPNGYPGDTVELTSYSGTLDLTPGTYVQKINTLLWDIDYTYGGTETDPNAWSDLDLVVNAVRSLQFGLGTTGSISQGGLLHVTWDNDFLSLADGVTTSFLVEGLRVDVTPLGLAEVGGSNFSGGNPWTQPQRDVMARFVVSTVPDTGSTLALLGVGLAGFSLWRRKVGA